MRPGAPLGRLTPLGAVLLALLALGGAFGPARGQTAAPPGATAQATLPRDRLIVTVSQPEVLISSNFAGVDLVVFGAVETADATVPADVVVTVRGPGETFLTWRKSRVLGLWINTDSRTFIDVPSFLSVQANRPFDRMASEETQRVEQIGLAHYILVQRVGPDFADVVVTDPFRAAFIRTLSAEGLYQEDQRGVRFLAPNVFRTGISIPGRAPIGRYTVDVILLRAGKVTARASSTFNVQKGGFEQEVTSLAQNSGLLYGISVAFGSLIVGFIANILFRKE